MLKFTPILLALLVGAATFFLSSWRLRRVLNERSGPLRDPVLAAHAASFAHVLDMDRIEVHVFEVPEPNGLASPDGRVFITRGFLDAHRRGEVTAEELASVIAHELGHLALGHSRRRLIDVSGQNALRMALAVVLGRFLPVVGIWIADLVARVVAARLSRQDEFEADAYAAALMTKAGLGTGPQKAMFRKLLARAPRGAMPAWLLSHPRVEDRIAAIEALERRWASALPGPG